MKAWFIIVCMAIVLIIILGLRIRYIKYESKLTGKYMDMMDEMYQYIQERVEMTRRFRHDLKNHIDTIDRLMQADDKKRKPDFIEREKLISCYENVKEKRYCRDEFVDTVLSMKADYCDEHNIAFNANVQDAEYSMIDSMSLIALIYNILDNAAEASLYINDSDMRQIDFHMGVYADHVEIRCKNNIEKNANIDFRTRKANKTAHGFGMNIIKSIVEKYNGEQRTAVDRKLNTYEIFVKLNTSSADEAGEEE